MRRMFYLLDKNKNAYPCSRDDWANMFEHPTMRRVRFTHLKTMDIEISTIFLGLDHSFRMYGPPIIFETMVFWKDGIKGLDQYQDRYSTYEEAVKGHHKIVRMVIAAIRKHENKN